MTRFDDMQELGMDPVIQHSDMRLRELCIEDPQYGSFGYDGLLAVCLTPLGTLCAG